MNTNRIALIVALVMLAGLIWLGYEFVTHVNPDARDCLIQWNRPGCGQQQ